MDKLYLFVFAIICTAQVASSRHMTFVLNPGCDKPACNPSEYNNDSFPNLAYVRSDSSNETMHYLWSTIDSISVLLVKTSLKAELQVNWEQMLNSSDNAISFTEKPIYFVSLVVTKILEYNDKNDEADLGNVNATDTIVHLPSSLTWKVAKAENVSANDEISVMFETVEDLGTNSSLGNGTFKIKSSIYATEDRDDLNPRLVHTPDSMQLEWALQGIDELFPKSRFAFEFAMVSDSKDGKFADEKTSTMDDEYTPGVFTMMQVRTPNNKAYMQWKPIVYTSEDRTVEAMTSARYYSLVSKSVELNGSLPYNYKGSEVASLVSCLFNVSLGQPTDNFYNASDYQVWTLAIGLGEPPQESPSLTIILTLVIGLGIPVVLMIGGSIYMFYLRIVKARRAGSETTLNTSIQ